ncbi:hypothetical protein B2G71_20910, partial [Novosphingobium sp. PC22D]
MGTGGLVAATALGGEAGAAVATTTALATFASTLGGGIAGNVAYDAAYGAFDSVANALKNAARNGRLPLNHDFAREARRAQLDGIRYILLQYRDQIRADPTAHDMPSEEAFVDDALDYVSRQRRDTDDAEFLLGEPVAQYLEEVIPTARRNDSALRHEDFLDLLKSAERHTLEELELAIRHSAPPDFRAAFMMEGNTVCWQSAAQAFFIEAIKSDDRLKTVVLFDRLHKLDTGLSGAVALIRQMAGDLGERFDRIDREIAARASASTDTNELAAFLRGAVRDDMSAFEENLQHLLDARFPRDQFQASRPAEEVSRIFSRRSMRFLGRREPIADVENHIIRHGSSLMIITAPPGMGKSALMANLVRRRIDAGDVVVRHFILSQELRTVDEIDIFGHLVAQLAAIFDVEQRPELNERALADWLHHHLKQDRDEGQRLVLFLDGLDEANSDRLSQILPDRLGHGVHLVVSCRASGLEEPRALKGWLIPRPNIETRRIVLNPMRIADITWWLEDFVGHIDYETATRMAAKLERACDGIPLFLSYLIEDVHARLADGATADEMLVEIGELPEPFDEYVRTQLDTLDGEVEWSSGAQFVLALLTVTKSPISVRDIDRVIGLARKAHVDVSTINLNALNHRVARWMIQQRDDGGIRLQFVHPRLAEVFARVLEYRTESARTYLLEFCRLWQSNPSEYATQSGVEHLLDGADASPPTVAMTEAVAPLFDAGYLGERGVRGRLSSVLQVLLQAQEIWKDQSHLRSWFELISRDYSILSQAHNGSFISGLWPDKLAQFKQRAALPGHFSHRQPEKGRMEGHTGPVKGARALDGGRILSWSQDRTLRLWDPEGHPLGVPMEGHTEAINGARALDGKRILSWSRDGTLRLWDFEGRPLGVPMEGHTDAINGARALDGGRILSCSLDGTLRLWDFEGNPIGVPMEGHTDAINGARALDGKRILSCSLDGTLRLWDFEGHPLGAPMEGHTDAINGARALDGKRILSWSRDGTLRLW